MKPWEETWRTDPLDGRQVEAEDRHGAWRIAEAYGGTRAGDGHASRFETARLIAAAPEMARALLALVCESPTCTRTQCNDARAALKKAGVLTE